MPVTLLAGIPASNQTLYHQIQFLVGDAAAYLEGLPPDGKSLLIVRDIELDRAREIARADTVACAQDFTPAGGLSGDRDVATAQAIVEVLKQRGVTSVVTDRTLPFLYASHLLEAGIALALDDELGVRTRRVKSAAEIKALEHAQKVTGEIMTLACKWIATADVNSAGELMQEGEVLTSERVRRRITQWCIERGFSNVSDSIVVSVPHVADCHHHGTGSLKTGQPVIVDIFPRDDTSRYYGDCTRTVVHGTPTEELVAMHRAVVAAKQAACEALRPGTTGDAVHKVTVATLKEHGYEYVPGSMEHDPKIPALRHGTGHGIGLDVHEPILLSVDGGEILAGEVFTVEPGLYSSTLGGVRVEDMAHVTAGGYEILSPLYEGLDWRGV
ncbi:M24 family metallopeptidase [Aeoliella sp. SH292]|uniref:M24 family metallopeptidase n=1 Tax=Aeoliella sp. SH292 TaxID=3454464 RepID=UPI003F9CA5BD